MDTPTDILRALAERNRLQNVALRGELHHVGASQLRQLDRALDALNPGELGAMAQAAENQVDWFDAFQDVQHFLMERDLIQEADLHPKKPEQTLITALTRALKDHEPLSPATTRRLTELAASWDAESNRLQDRYALGLSTAASQLRHVLLKVEPSTPGAAPVKPSWVKGVLPSHRPGTLRDALASIGHVTTCDTWKLTVQGGMNGDTVSASSVEVGLDDDLSGALHALHTDKSLVQFSLPELWRLKASGGGVNVNGSPRFITLEPGDATQKPSAPAPAAATAAAATVPVFRDASRRVDVLQDETLSGALRRLTRSSDWTQASGSDGRWVVHSVAGERSGGHFHISTAALLHKALHGSVKAYFGREYRDLTLTLYGLDERHVLLDVKTGGGDPLEVVLELR
jgi:hypothetical protein